MWMMLSFAVVMIVCVAKVVSQEVTNGHGMRLSDNLNQGA